MGKEEKYSKNMQDIEESLYSSLNIGSFLELKRNEQKRPKKNKEMALEQHENTNLEFHTQNIPKEKVKKAVPKERKINKETTSNTVEPFAPSEYVKKQEEVIGSFYTEEELRTLDKVNKAIQSKTEQEELEELKENTVIESEEKHPLMEETVEIPIKNIRKEETPSEEKKQEEPNVEKKKEVRKGKKQKKEKKSKALMIGVVICAIMDIFAVTGLFLTYGPISYFRDMLVTSAMTTMNHKYLARIFYNDQMIEKILSENVVEEIGENTNTADINFAGSNDTGTYESIYEEQILKRDKDQLYKVINIKENGYVGYLVAIYDASRVELVSATRQGYGGALLTDMAKKNGAKVAINASGFLDGSASGMGSVPVGTVIKDGKILSNKKATGYGGGIAGFNKDHVLVLTKESPQTAIKNGMVDAVEFGPFLIVNGKPAQIKGNGGWGIAPRTVLAQRKDGIVLFLVVDGRNAKHSLGIDMNGLIKILTRYQAHNAVNLDGGGSSTLVVEGKLTNIPCGYSCGERYVPNAWMVK